MEPLECRVLSSAEQQALIAFLNDLSEAHETEFFHPHPFTEDALQKIIRTADQDLYYVLCEGGRVVGYGMLRGWDEGYQIPSLGIAIHPAARNAGLGKALMHFLHGAARRRGASKVRLRVKAQNARAMKLYQDLGYVFGPEEQGFLVGFLQLDRARSALAAKIPIL
jgi:ribosomal-protein-alanine N-acetyltransferase